METVERYTFGEGNSGDIFGLVTIGVLPITHSQCVVDGEMKPVNVCTN